MAERQEQHSHGAWNRKKQQKPSAHCINKGSRSRSSSSEQSTLVLHWNKTNKMKNNQDRLFGAMHKRKPIYSIYTKNVNSFVEFLSFSRFLRQFQIFHLIFFLQHLCRISLVCVCLHSPHKYQRNQHCRPFWFIMCIYICVYENVANKLSSERLAHGNIFIELHIGWLMIGCR